MSLKIFENLTLPLLSQIEQVKIMRATFHHLLQFIVCKSIMYGSHYYNITLYFNIFTPSRKIYAQIQFSYFLLVLLVTTIIWLNFHNFWICFAIFLELNYFFEVNRKSLTGCHPPLEIDFQGRVTLPPASINIFQNIL